MSRLGEHAASGVTQIGFPARLPNQCQAVKSSRWGPDCLRGSVLTARQANYGEGSTQPQADLQRPPDCSRSSLYTQLSTTTLSQTRHSLIHFSLLTVTTPSQWLSGNFGDLPRLDCLSSGILCQFHSLLCNFRHAFTLPVPRVAFMGVLILLFTHLTYAFYIPGKGVSCTPSERRLTRSCRLLNAQLQRRREHTSPRE